LAVRTRGRRRTALVCTVLPMSGVPRLLVLLVVPVLAVRGGSGSLTRLAGDAGLAVAVLVVRVVVVL
jgi:hypothetical protein